MNIFQFIDALSKLESFAEADPKLYHELKAALVEQWEEQTAKAKEQKALEERMKGMGLHLGGK